MLQPKVSFTAIGQLTELADYTIAFAIRAVCHIGVADRLAGGPMKLAELAEATETHAPSLLRVMRALTHKEVFAEPEPGVFELTPMGELLRDDHPMSMRWAFRLRPDVDAWAMMDHSIRTGEIAFDHVFGTDYWHYLAGEPELLAQFRDSQRALTRVELQALVRAYDWSQMHTVVDIGGHDGTFVSGLLARFPHLHGTVFDLPGTVAQAERVLAEAGVADRCDIVAGDVFETPMPAGADAYLIKRVLIGFSDEEIVDFARIMRAAMGAHSRLLLLEPQDGEDVYSIAMDLHMLVLGKGHVRSPDEFGVLLEKGGLRRTRVVDARFLNVIEARVDGQ